MDSRSAGKRTNAVQVDPRIAGLAADRKSGNFRFTATAAARSANSLATVDHYVSSWCTYPSTKTMPMDTQGSIMIVTLSGRDQDGLAGERDAAPARAPATLADL